MNRTLPTYGFDRIDENPLVAGIFVDERVVVVSVRQPIVLPATEDVT